MSKSQEDASVVRPEKSRLGIRDLATIGIFTAILFVLCIITGMVTAWNPIVFLFNPALHALLGAVFYALIVTRVRKPGAAILTAVIFGLGWGVLGGWLLTGLMVIAGLAGELLLYKGGANRISRVTLAWIAFEFANFGGGFGTTVLNADAFRAAGERTGQSAEYINAVIGAAQSWFIVVALAAIIVAAIAGMAFARRVLRKHFTRGQSGK
jgi:energy-coupling factor transport system substrate-specific component